MSKIVPAYDPVVEDRHRPSRAYWADIIQAACDAICYAPLGETACITVGGRLAGDPDDARWLRHCCGKLAKEYGLWSEVALSDDSFTIRMVRSIQNQGRGRYPFSRCPSRRDISPLPIAAGSRRLDR